MEVKERQLKGVLEITLKPIFDGRGFFMRTYDSKLLSEKLDNIGWVQENHSRTVKKNVIRGLHFQLPPYSETKLLRCIKGSILDVFVDLREGSPTFGKWDSIELSDKNNKMVLIPKGFAHGFCSLTGISEVLYKVDNYYNKPSEVGLIWNDKTLNINWPTNNPILSEKDSNNLTFKQFQEKYKSIKI